MTFANVSQLVFLDKEVECPLRSFIEESHTNLVGHANRIKERFFPDWEEMGQTLDLNTHLPKPPPKEGGQEGGGGGKEGGGRGAQGGRGGRRACR